MRFRAPFATLFAIAVVVLSLALPARADFEAGRSLFAQGKHEAAFREFKRLAAEGHAGAQSRLAEMYFAGRGVGRDVAAALRWFRAAAERGDIPAQVNLGMILAQGGDPAEAVKWLRRAAGQGDADAMANLATLYLTGRGVAPDPVEGLRWFARAAALGNPETQLQLGQLYAQGVTGAADTDKAILWLRRAANQGHAPAQIRLGALYAGEADKARDVVRAYKWLHMAVMQGAEEASPALADLAGKMTPDQITAAKRLAGKWQPGAE